MNNANAIALIATGALSTEKMLRLCQTSFSKSNDAPSTTDSFTTLEVVRAFIDQLGMTQTHLPNRELIDMAHTHFYLDTYIVKLTAKYWSRADFDHAFQVLNNGYDLICMAAASRDYNQQEVFGFCDRYPDDLSDNPPSFWEGVVKANILDVDGLYKVAMLDSHNLDKMQELCLLIISKKMMNAEQLMNLCEKYQSNRAIAFAAIATEKLSDDQIIKLMSHVDNNNWPNEILQHFQFQDRTIEDLFALGEKARSSKLWEILSYEMLEKIADRSASDEQIITLMALRSKNHKQISFGWSDFIQYLRLEERTVEDLVMFGEKADSDELWPSIVEAINSKKAAQA
ncbi:MAG: hypothetical protein WCK60_03450 [Candidatus Nomurabacteria bacterium]